MKPQKCISLFCGHVCRSLVEKVRRLIEFCRKKKFRSFIPNIA